MDSNIFNGYVSHFLPSCLVNKNCCQTKIGVIDKDIN